MSDRLQNLADLERRVLWLASWMIHNANHVRPGVDGLKVGGHQASSASSASILTALYFDALRPQDRVAVKPHASPVFHAIQYLSGRQDLDQLVNFRALGGAQSYPSRTKDKDDVDFSTGSVGLGVAVTGFAALARDYLAARGGLATPAGRMIALVGDAEMDEGNVFEALLEGWKHHFRDLWWIVDYNRQSLDSIVSDRLFNPIEGAFASTGWKVEVLKYGRLLEAAFERKGGGALRDWIDGCPNARYSALVFKGGAALRQVLTAEIGGKSGVKAILDDHDDDALHRLITNLGGHDLDVLTSAYAEAASSDQPRCLIAYTIKGRGLPLAGHKDNHAGLLTPDQMDAFRMANGIAPGQEWQPFAGMENRAEALRRFIAQTPFAAPATRRHEPPPVPVPPALPAIPAAQKASTQQGFGQIMSELAKSDLPLADAIVTTSPDVTVSTNLGGWVNRRGLFGREARPDTFRDEQIASVQKWAPTPTGQHLELGIAEHNLFLNLAALGLSHSLFGTRLIPVGTLYDPFVLRGMDAFNYALYQDARFILVGTPSGLTLAPEGGAHQSVITPLIGLSQPKLTMLEPAHLDELSTLMRWAFKHIQAADGESVYFRLSTRPLPQPDRPLDAAAVIEGGYWLKPPAEGAPLALIACGAVMPEALEAHAAIAEDIPGCGLLCVTSYDRLYRGWQATPGASAIDRLLSPLAPGAGLVTLLDGHPSALAWMGAVRGQRLRPLGTTGFGQSGSIPDLYRLHGLDAEAVLDAAAALLAGG